MTQTLRPNSLDAFWMPFTPNKAFKADPRMVVRADGMFYFTSDGRPILDGTSGLWCVAAGHNQPKIVEAIRKAAGELDYAGNFNLGHPLAFEFANRLTGITPDGLDRIFFSNSGSESVESALKIALAYQRARGKPNKYRLIGRERAYHGVNFGGISVGGIGRNRLGFGPMVGGVDHLPHTHDIARNAFTRGQPEHGAELADALERLVLLHDASTIAAVIVEPVAGSTGVLVPPKGYLKRLRELCTKHDILLIFDEVITGFRVGLGGGQGHYGVRPDLTILGKAIGGGMPLAAFGGREDLMRYLSPSLYPHDYVFQSGTFSGLPLSVAAGLAALRVLEEGGAAHLCRLGERARQGLAELTRRLGIPACVTGLGSLFHLHFTDRVVTDARLAEDADHERLRALHTALLARGCYFYAGRLGFLSTVHTEADIDYMLEAVATELGG